MPGTAGSTWSHPPPAGISTLIGTGKVVCSPKNCKYTVRCVAGTEQAPCGFAFGITKQGALVTRPTVSLDNEDGSPFYPWPDAPVVQVPAGQSTTLTLRVIPPGKDKINRALRKGKKVIRGEWEANRLGFAGEAGDEFLYQYGEVTIKLTK